MIIEDTPERLGAPLEALKGKTVYISGAITSDPHYLTKFARAQESLKVVGVKQVFNPPDILGPGHSYDAYMEVDFVFVRRAEAVFALRDWRTSPGARAEVAYAECLKKIIVYEAENTLLI